MQTGSYYFIIFSPNAGLIYQILYADEGKWIENYY